MILEGAEIPAGEVIETEICIIGAGAAGITMALELTGAPFRVAIIEAGGFDYPENGQPNYEGTQSGIEYADLDACRLRYFGGTTNHWGGYCRSLDPIDYEKRDWIPHSGWPITLDDVKAHFPRAAEIIGLHPALFDGQHWSKTAGLPMLPFDPDKFHTGATQIHGTRFGEVHRDAVKASPNVTCYLNSSVVDMVMGETDDLLKEVTVVNAAGNRSTFRARHFVLACGGMENPRMLLNANKVRNKGIGNEHDNVGRYFMEHRVSSPGMILVSDGSSDLSFYQRNGMPTGEYVEGSLHLSEPTIRAERICNAQFSMEPYDGIRTQGDRSLAAIRDGLKKFISGGGWVRDFNVHVGNVICDIDYVAGNLARRITGSEAKTSVWLLKMEVEQVPNPDSRITLNDQVDNLGLRRINLHWETSEIEKHSVVRSMEIMGEELGRLGIGRMRIEMADDPNVWSRFDTWGFHHAGTTRMSADPRDGVVDANCKVHSVDNLYVVGNSVFTTVGTSNPTFTITSLSVRLAGHLKGLLTA
ncbi:hypothetical protein N825_01955 [Skermanella stibiiresistens SB22]|uniref:GMC family oxidoreductase n=1 Tax=Skermanella stibiiresistens SB22 TaxID=1385369 RepID=W9H9A8_9PROT|nr:GMC family oxidoreductase [Skermanella stibiiresistens]EWY42860.1 hypothetical protein N825_01955 [Skermanella stibiiresistens SB22]